MPGKVSGIKSSGEHYTGMALLELTGSKQISTDLKCIQMIICDTPKKVKPGTREDHEWAHKQSLKS